MINFINNGTDERILKSLPTEDISEDLEKAMNKQGLVQKEIQYKTPSGKIATRKQWVRAGEEQKTDKTSQSKTDDISKPASESKILGDPEFVPSKDDVKLTVDNFNSLMKKGTKVTRSYLWTDINQNAHRNVITGTVQFVTNNIRRDGKPVAKIVWDKESKKKLVGPHGEYNYIDPEFDLKDGKIWVISDSSLKDDKSQSQSQQSTTKKQWVKLDTNNKEQLKSQDAYCYVGVKNKKSGKVDQKKIEGSVSKINSYIAQKRREGTLYDAGDIWVNDVQSNQSTTADKPQSAGQKLSKDDAKKMTQSFTSKIGKTDAERNDFMDKVKAQGITWKEKNDNGTEVSVAINWMRCCMALNKHFENGGTFNNSDTSLSSNDKPTKNPYDLYSKKYNTADEYKKALAEKYNGITDVDKIKSDKDIADFINYETQKGYYASTRLIGGSKGVKSTWDMRNGEVSVSDLGSFKIKSVLTIPWFHSDTFSDAISKLSKIGITLTQWKDNQYLIERSGKKASSQPSPDGKTTGTMDHPFVTSETKSGKPYQIWMDNGRIYGSKPGINLGNFRNLREITDFSKYGFKDFDEVRDYLKMYF